MVPPRQDPGTLALVDVEQRSSPPAYPNVPRSTSKLLQTRAFIFSHRQAHYRGVLSKEVGSMPIIKNIAICGQVYLRCIRDAFQFYILVS